VPFEGGPAITAGGDAHGKTEAFPLFSHFGGLYIFRDPWTGTDILCKVAWFCSGRLVEEFGRYLRQDTGRDGLSTRVEGLIGDAIH